MPYIGTSPSNGVRRVHTYTATASQTTFTGASSEGVTLSYVDTNYIDVFQNGVLLGSADYTSTSGTSVVLAQGASADDLIVIVVYDVFSVADTVSKTNGGSFDSAITSNGGVIVDNITIDGQEIDVSSGDFTLDVAGDITLDAGGADIIFKDDGTQIGRIRNVSSGELTIQADVQDKDIVFNGNDNGSTVTALTIDMSAGGNVLIGGTDNNPSFNNTIGTAIRNDGEMEICSTGDQALDINRQQDGQLVVFRSAGNTEGSISISGSTTSFNGGHIARWSRLLDNSKDTTIVKGTVMTNLDEMVEWSHDEVLWTDEDNLPDGVSVGDVKKSAYTEDNEQLNKMAVSSVEGDANVAGVFVNWDNDDDFNDMNIAMTGDMVIRIAKGTTVARGDLLMSAGDGTAKPQDDDIVRSKTIAKVTSTNVSHTYDDGTYLVPCVLMAC